MRVTSLPALLRVDRATLYDGPGGGIVGKKYAIVGGKLVDGTGSAPVENALILIGEDGRIEYAGKHEDVPAEAGYNSIRCCWEDCHAGLDRYASAFLGQPDR